MTINIDFLSKEFGKKVKIERIKKELSQEKLAELTGMHRTAISIVERGKVSPSLDTVARLANGLGLTLCEMVDLNF